MLVNFGATAHDYAQHRAGFPASLFDRLAALGIGVAPQSIVDLGTGTGSLGRGFARRGCQVVGVDIAKPLLDEARRLDDAEGLTTEYRLAPAEDTGLPREAFDVVCAGQCWHWFDRRRAAAEVKRLLRSDGAVVIAHFDWLPLPGNVVHATETLIQHHNPQWSLGGGVGIYPQWFRDVADAEFIGIESFSHDTVVPYTHEGWRGRVRASAGVGGSLPLEKVRAFDDALAALLRADYPGDVVEAHHRIFGLVARKASPS